MPEKTLIELNRFVCQVRSGRLCRLAECSFHMFIVQGHKERRKWVSWSASGSDTGRLNRVTSLTANIIIPRTKLNHLFGLCWPLYGARTLASMAYFSSAKLGVHLPFKVNPVSVSLCLHECRDVRHDIVSVSVHLATRLLLNSVACSCEDDTVYIARVNKLIKYA